MSIEKLSFQHQQILGERLKKVRTSLSEYSFANLYLFRIIHDYQVLTEGQEIFVIGKTYDGQRYVMPTAEPDSSTAQKILDLAREYDCIFPIPEEWLKYFDGNNVRQEFLEGDSDYIFRAEKIATYRGQKLHSKKNLLNQFLSLYSPRPLPLTRERMSDALNILESWQTDTGESHSATDYVACREAFELYDELVLCGGIYYVNDEPAGFIIGEEITDSMFTLHFAKGKRKFKGMYQYMYNHFVNILPKKYEELNFEQDMGNLALRIAKSSYHPDRLLRKYRIRAA